MDLFEYYENQPKNLKKICDKYSKILSNTFSYKICDRFLNEVEKIGYTFEYGLDCEPYNLKLKKNENKLFNLPKTYKKPCQKQKLSV